MDSIRKRRRFDMELEPGKISDFIEQIEINLREINDLGE